MFAFLWVTLVYGKDIIIIYSTELSPLEYFSLILFIFVQCSVLAHIKVFYNDVIASQKGSDGERK